MRRRGIDYEDPRDERIRRLEEELWTARRAIIDLMPDGTRRVLTSYYHCGSRSETYKWEHDAVEEIIGHAEALSREEGSYLGPRARCPLCGDESTSPYESGFSLPEGLRRHLTGWGNVRQCSVLGAAASLAREYADREFSEAEQAEAAQQQTRLRERRRTETLYRVMPDEEARLLDEDARWGRRARTPEEMAWAESRLADLDFRCRTEGLIKTHTRSHDGTIVYADPRAEGRIDFWVFDEAALASKRRTRFRRGYLGGFHLLDSWRHDLPGKYEKRESALVARRADS